VDTGYVFDSDSDFVDDTGTRALIGQRPPKPGPVVPGVAAVSVKVAFNSSKYKALRETILAGHDQTIAIPAPEFCMSCNFDSWYEIEYNLRVYCDKNFTHFRKWITRTEETGNRRYDSISF